jgi:LPS-assembly lipoprotein
MSALRNHSRLTRLKPGFMLVVICCLIVLEGCGFRLRGSIGGDLALPSLYIQSSGNNLFVNELRQALGNTQTKVVSERAAAALIIGVGAEKLDRRVLTVDASGRVQEYELHYAVSFAVNDASARSLLGSQTISERRSFEFTGAQLYQDMRRSAVQRAVHRLQALSMPETLEPGTAEPGATERGATEPGTTETDTIEVTP